MANRVSQEAASTQAVDQSEGQLANVQQLMQDGPGFSALQFDLRDLMARLYRHRVGMLAIMGAVLVAGVALILLLPKVYQASASIQIDQQAAKVLGTEDTQPVATGLEADRFLQTQVDILQSRELARRVIDKLGLAANDQFLDAMGTKSAPDTPLPRRIEDISNTLQKNLSVDLPRNSRVVGISFRSRDAGLAAKVANSYVENFIANNIDRKYSASDYSRGFLQDQLSQTKTKLANSEQALIDYAREARLIDASAGARGGESSGPRSLLTAKLVSINDSLAGATAARIAAEEHWNQVRAAPPLTIPEVLGNPAMLALLQKRAELNADLFQLRQRLKPDHPTILQAQAQLSELSKQISGLAEGVRKSIKGQYDIARLQEQAVSSQIEALKNQTLSEQARDVQYNILKREVDTNRQQFQALLTRYNELTAESGVTVNNITAVDAAEVPRNPISPKPVLILALAMLGGLGLAVAYAFLRDHFDEAIRDPADVENILGLPLLGAVPKTEQGTPLEQIALPKSEISEAYNAIRTSIELSFSSGMAPSLFVTSASKGEGKSTTSYSVARMFALQGKRVLLVDSDMRRPSLHRYFETNLDTKGLSSLLAGLHSAEEAILSTTIDGLYFLPSGPLPPDPATLLGSSSVAKFVAGLLESFDLVVIDGPPVMALADAVQVSQATSATVFVVEAGETQLGQARAAIARLLRVHTHVIGVVVTKYNTKDDRYSKYSNYYNYRYSD